MTVVICTQTTLVMQLASPCYCAELELQPQVFLSLRKEVTFCLKIFGSGGVTLPVLMFLNSTAAQIVHLKANLPTCFFLTSNIYPWTHCSSCFFYLFNQESGFSALPMLFTSPNACNTN